MKGGSYMDIRSTNPENLDERLKRELMQGKFDSAIKNMKPDEAQKFNAVLSNPQMLEKLMSAPQAQALYQKLTGGQGGQNNNGRR